MTKTVRSRFSLEIGAKVEGLTILEKYEIAPPNLAEKRRGIYDYLVEVPPAPEKARSARSSATPSPRSAPTTGSFTRSTPDEMGSVIRRLPSK